MPYNPRSLENLRRFDLMTPEEHRQMSLKGNRASVKKRRQNRQKVEKMKLHDRALKELQEKSKKERRETLKLFQQSVQVLTAAKQEMSAAEDPITRKARKQTERANRHL